MKMLALAVVAAVALTGCFRRIVVERLDSAGDGYVVTYLNVGFATDLSTLEVQKWPTNVTVRVNGVKTDVSKENSNIIAAGGTAVGNVAQKVIEGVK